MAKVDVTKNKMAMFVLCEAIKGNMEKFNDLQADENGLYDVSITLNGHEIDVNRFIENLDVVYRDAVKRQAADLLYDQYDKIAHTIGEIQESLESHNKLFNDKIFEDSIDE